MCRFIRVRARTNWFSSISFHISFLACVPGSVLVAFIYDISPDIPTNPGDCYHFFTEEETKA